MQMLEFIEELAKKICEIELCVSNLSGLQLGDVEELWDMIALVEYPSLAAMKEMVESADYREIAKHRDAGLAGQLNIKIKGALGSSHPT